MAYGQTQNSSKFGTRSANPGAPKTGGSAASTGGTTAKKEAIFRTGLFTSDKEGSKTLASVKVKEDVVIPAGSYINLYHNVDKTNEAGPDYSISVMPGVTK